MGAFIIALFALWANPLIGLFINIGIDKRPNEQKKYVLFSVGTIAIIGLALFTGMSTASRDVDYFFWDFSTWPFVFCSGLALR